MDKPITETPDLGDLRPLVEKAEKAYFENFNGEAWFGRCIFLSWWCERGTCTFCFRSAEKHHIKFPDKARRNVKSIIQEAELIRKMNWRLEFLTGGYGILDDRQLIDIIRQVSETLGEKIWVNLGEIGSGMLEEMRPYVQGIVSSIETVEPKLHKLVCPDKPIEPYVEMMKKSRKLGYRQSIAIIIGLGEKRGDFPLLKRFIEDNMLDRITVYALRPVQGTPFTKGPSTDDLLWWIANIRLAFPKIEIIAGTAIYRIPEICLLLRAGANAITKLPANRLIGNDLGKQVEEEVKKAKRRFISRFSDI
jgi:biotin synthase-like enzyme